MGMITKVKDLFPDFETRVDKEDGSGSEWVAVKQGFDMLLKLRDILSPERGYACLKRSYLEYPALTPHNYFSYASHNYIRIAEPVVVNISKNRGVVKPALRFSCVQAGLPDSISLGIKSEDHAHGLCTLFYAFYALDPQYVNRRSKNVSSALSQKGTDLLNENCFWWNPCPLHLLKVSKSDDFNSKDTLRANNFNWLTFKDISLSDLDKVAGWQEFQDFVESAKSYPALLDILKIWDDNTRFSLVLHSMRRDSNSPKGYNHEYKILSWEFPAALTWTFKLRNGNEDESSAKYSHARDILMEDLFSDKMIYHVNSRVESMEVLGQNLVRLQIVHPEG